MPEEKHRLEGLLNSLANSRWKELRKAHNREFMTCGLGTEWDRIKTSEWYIRECEEIRLLRDYIGLKPEL